MTTVDDATSLPGRSRRVDGGRVARRHGWTIGVYVLLLLLIIGYILALAPVAFTSFDLKTIVIGALPLAFAAMAQSVIVISGGIDLSLGVIVAVINVLAASLMETASFATTLLIALGLMVVGVVIGCINGALIVLSGVPDIVVTLAMSLRLGRRRAADHAHARRRGADRLPGARHRHVLLGLGPCGCRGHRARAPARLDADPLASARASRSTRSAPIATGRTCPA